MKRVPFFDNPVLRGQLPTWRARLVLILLFGGFTVLAGRALFCRGCRPNSCSSRASAAMSAR